MLHHPFLFKGKPPHAQEVAWFKYHPPIEVKVVEPIKVVEETITYNVDPIVPTAYIEKPPFPVRIKGHA